MLHLRLINTPSLTLTDFLLVDHLKKKGYLKFHTQRRVFLAMPYGLGAQKPGLYLANVDEIHSLPAQLTIPASKTL